MAPVDGVPAPGWAIDSEQEAQLLDQGWMVRNTFIEPSPPLTENETRRANSDPTSSRSSSRSKSQSSSASKDEFLSARSRQQQQQLQQSQQQRQGQEAASKLRQLVLAGEVEETDDRKMLRQRAKAKNLDLDDVLGKIPLDEHGSLTSLGSVNHLAGQCKPCAFSPVAGSPDVAVNTCTEGILCQFCHFRHAVKPKFRLRPCKGKRERMMQKLTTQVAEEIAKSPGLAVEDFINIEDLPSWIKGKPQLIEKLKENVRRRIIGSPGMQSDDQEEMDELAETPVESRGPGLGSLNAASPSSANPCFGTVPGISHAVPGVSRAAVRSFRLSL